MTAAALPSRKTMLDAVTRRDPSWDGLFIVAVATTGIACRPTCPSRPARRENLRFFPTLDAAHAAGFRSCLRCRPERPPAIPEIWNRAIALAESMAPARPNDATLRANGLDPVQLRRLALRIHGITFHAWLRSERIASAERRIHHGEGLDHVILTSGYSSHSGFRDAFTKVIGQAPGRNRTGDPVVVTTIDSPIGPLITAATDEGLCLLEFADENRLERQIGVLSRWFPGAILKGTHPLLAQLAAELADYFAGKLHTFTLPLATRGTAFELATWKALTTIPYGETRSYQDIARQIGNAGAVRAVGSANGRNRIAIVIPCHRVVNANGKLGGYGGGLWRKRRLLELEAGSNGTLWEE